MPARILAVHKAINQRLREFSGRASVEEVRELRSTLVALKTLREERTSDLENTTLRSMAEKVCRKVL